MKKKERRGRKEGEEKKAVVVVLMFIMANCWTEKVHLPITFSRNNPAIITRQEIKQPAFPAFRHIRFIISRCKPYYLSEVIYAGPNDSRDTSKYYIFTHDKDLCCNSQSEKLAPV